MVCRLIDVQRKEKRKKERGEEEYKGMRAKRDSQEDQTELKAIASGPREVKGACVPSNSKKKYTVGCEHLVSGMSGCLIINSSSNHYFRSCVLSASVNSFFVNCLYRCLSDYLV